MTRRHFGRELWDRACDAVREPDGLPVFRCGAWTIEKLFFLCQYLAQVSQAMVGNPKFSAINYVDLFCGSGVCEVEEEGRKRRYPGSALLAASCAKPFTNLLLADSDGTKVDALEQRLARIKTQSAVQTWTGDANELVEQVGAAIPPRSLTVAFLDPYNLEVRFESVKQLALQRPLDLLILFADAIDIVRNVDEYYYPGRSDKLDLFLGTAEWRRDWDQLQNRDGGNTRALFAKIYLQQLAALGYHYNRTRTINGDAGPLYRLVYASKNELGLKFWDIAASEDVQGNRSFFWL